MAAEELQRELTPVLFTDAEIKQIMTNASKEADRVLAILAEKGSTSAAIRSAQISMAQVNASMWGSVGSAVQVGVGDALWSAAEMQALFDEKLFKAVGFSSQFWRSSMIAQSKVGLQSVLSRKENGYTLSERVYRNQALSKGFLDRTINNGLVLGKGPKEIAADVKKFIDPKTPGGASYAALRLGRTEVGNAFHRTSINKYAATPWVEKVKWNLSGSHGRPDQCNEYATAKTFKGGEAGEWLPSDVPAKPHPNCLCYVSPQAMDLDAFAKAFKDGKFDSYIDQQMGCYRVA